MLAGAYISLATFINDDDVDIVTNAHDSGDKEKLIKIRRIYGDVLNGIEILTDEINQFRPLEVTNTQEEATL